MVTATGEEKKRHAILQFCLRRLKKHLHVNSIIKSVLLQYFTNNVEAQSRNPIHIKLLNFTLLSTIPKKDLVSFFPYTGVRLLQKTLIKLSFISRQTRNRVNIMVDTAKIICETANYIVFLHSNKTQTNKTKFEIYFL